MAKGRKISGYTTEHLAKSAWAELGTWKPCMQVDTTTLIEPVLLPWTATLETIITLAMSCG
jgi:hypothetical protein